MLVKHPDHSRQICQGHPEVHRVLATNAPKSRPGRKKAEGAIASVRTQFDRHDTHSKALLAVRLAQEKPEFYEAFLSGEYKSLRGAAEAAGLLTRSNDPLPRLKSFWRKATKKDRAAFMKWLQTDDAKSERDCKHFTPFIPGLGPREHSEMLHQKSIMEYQLQRDRDERLWREQQAERDRQWRKEDQAAAAAAFKAERYKGWAVAAWTLAAALITWVISISVQQ